MSLLKWQKGVRLLAHRPLPPRVNDAWSTEPFRFNLPLTCRQLYNETAHCKSQFYALNTFRISNGYDLGYSKSATEAQNCIQTLHYDVRHLIAGNCRFFYPTLTLVQNFQMSLLRVRDWPKLRKIVIIYTRRSMYEWTEEGAVKEIHRVFYEGRKAQQEVELVFTYEEPC